MHSTYCSHTELPVISYQLSVIVVSFWSLFTGHCSLVTVHWSLFTGHWSLVTVHWSLVTGHCSLFEW
ncbi:hypothetical protein DP116_27305 [Brasilonema bromeliae SPC951]|uniref:Uncharacterized protein n=1 Tax=Brasilonema bromeliae SPC951 TaxID=385972 RepID=A0ABX1PEQ0_9CYAN|nr:hypothetical protein [Brasilonema bromeliae SPC951]